MLKPIFEIIVVKRIVQYTQPVYIFDLKQLSLVFSRILATWYSLHKRSLPWRKTSDPYKIWLSEIILQQTRINQGLPYYEKFIDQYPTVYDLANAPLKSVLRTWQGLGYYSRARNLHTCSEIIVNDYAGMFPANYKELKSLPGIGNYTAAAIGSFAFNLPVPVVDGNVLRFTTRYFGIVKDISKNSTHKEIFKILSELIPKDTPGEFNQAIMEFGSIQCTPKSPNCQECPFSQACFAYINNKVDTLPYKKKSGKIKARYFNYFIFEQNGRFKMKERKGKDIWKGLFEFDLIESKNSNLENPDQIEDTLLRDVIAKGKIINESAVYKHILSHQHIYAKFFHVNQNGNEFKEPVASESFYTEEEIQELPKPVLITNYLEDVSLGE